MPVDPSLEIKAGSPEEQEIKSITEFINNCGSNVDRDEDERMNFSTFLQLIARDRLTFAYIAIEKIPNLGGGLHHFIPAPAESIYYANKEVAPDLLEGLTDKVGKTAYQISKEDAPDWINRIRAGEIEYVQVVDGQIKKGFTRNDMIFKLGNPQNFIDNNGYPIGELEMATNSVTMFLQAENYNGLFFTSGFAARGLLHIQGDISPSQLQASTFYRRTRTS
jgi:hypothetical protein